MSALGRYCWKSLFRVRIENSKAADAFRARRREGPYRLTQNRPRTLVAALQSAAAAERSNNQHSRDFRSRSIFDFCNSIGTFRTWRDVRLESVNRLKADMINAQKFQKWFELPEADLVALAAKAKGK